MRKIVHPSGYLNLTPKREKKTPPSNLSAAVPQALVLSSEAFFSSLDSLLTTWSFLPAHQRKKPKHLSSASFKGFKTSPSSTQSCSGSFFLQKIQICPVPPTKSWQSHCKQSSKPPDSSPQHTATKGVGLGLAALHTRGGQPARWLYLKSCILFTVVSCCPGYICFSSSLHSTSPFIHLCAFGSNFKYPLKSLRKTDLILKLLCIDILTFFTDSIFHWMTGSAVLFCNFVFHSFSSADSLSSCCSHFSNFHSRGDTKRATGRQKTSQQWPSLTTEAITSYREQVFSRLALMFETRMLELEWHMV